MKRHRRGGFTLMEVLIALIILAVIAALAIPSYRRSVKQAESTEAVQQLHAIRRAEIAYFAGEGTYTESLERLPAAPTIDLPLTPRHFDYAVEKADEGQLLVMATSRAPVPGSELPLKVSIDEAGNVIYYWPESGSGGSTSTGGGSSESGSGGSSGGGSAGGGISLGGGSSDGGGSGGGGGGGSIISPPGNSDDASAAITHPPLPPLCPGGATAPGTLSYITRCEDAWTNWPDTNAKNITGTIGTESLSLAFDMVAGSSVSAVTDDLFQKGISISFDGSYFGEGDLCEGAYACFIRNTGDFPPDEPRVIPFIVFDPLLADEDPALLAGILAHEGTHFQQLLDGSLHNESAGTLTVVDIEFRAFWNGAVFWSDVRDTQFPLTTALAQDEEDLYNLAQQGEAALRNEIAARYL